MVMGLKSPTDLERGGTVAMGFEGSVKEGMKSSGLTAPNKREKRNSGTGSACWVGARERLYL